MGGLARWDFRLCRVLAMRQTAFLELLGFGLLFLADDGSALLRLTSAGLRLAKLSEAHWKQLDLAATCRAYVELK